MNKGFESTQNDGERWKKFICASLFLILLNLSAHFLPFERASIGNDDYALLVKANRLSLSEVVSLVPRQPNRPLAFFLLMTQERFINGFPERGLWIVFITTSLVLIAVFFFLRALVRDEYLAVIGAVVFCLLPNTLEVYHTTTTAYNEVAHFLYLISLTSMVYFAERENKFALVFALGCYTVAITIYETGFFLPLTLIGYAYLYNKRHLKTCLYFFIPAGAYFVFRTTKAFGFADPHAIHAHSLNLAMAPFNVVNVGLDLFHQYGGRYAARSLLYGIYEFFSMESPWIPALLLLNAGFAVVALLWLKGKSLSRVDRRCLTFGMLTFITLLIPAFINQTGGLGGRHLVLPSVGLVVVVLFYFQKVAQSARHVLLLVFAAALIVSQGNAWAQVVACRINAAVYETIQAKRAELMQADRVIIDTKSFADRIPFTWVQRDFNVLNTYYGAQTFEDWGLKSMVALATGGTGKPVYIATGSPRVIGQGLLEFGVSEYQGYRSVSKRVETVAREGTVIIDFKSVFGEQFSNGTRTTKMVFHQSLSK